MGTSGCGAMEDFISKLLIAEVLYDLYCEARVIVCQTNVSVRNVPERKEVTPTKN